MTPGLGVMRSGDGRKFAAPWVAFILLCAWMLSCVPACAQDSPSSDQIIVIHATVESSGCIVAKATGTLSVLLPPLETTISGSRSEPDGTLVSLQGLVVTADTHDFAGVLYVEQRDRSCGIGILGKFPVTRGDTVTVVGEICSVRGERFIRAEQVDPTP